MKLPLMEHKEERVLEELREVNVDIITISETRKRERHAIIDKNKPRTNF